MAVGAAVHPVCSVLIPGRGAALGLHRRLQHLQQQVRVALRDKILDWLQTGGATFSLFFQSGWLKTSSLWASRKAMAVALRSVALCRSDSTNTSTTWGELRSGPGAELDRGHLVHREIRGQ